MLSPARPVLTVFGTPNTVNGQTRHLPAARALDQARAHGMLRHDDPRLSIDPHKIASLALRSYEGLEHAAIHAVGKDGQQQGFVANMLLMARHPGPADLSKVDPAYGKEGRLANAMETAGVRLYTTAKRTGDSALEAQAMALFAVAAAAHTQGAQQAATRGTDRNAPSVIEAAGAQKRDPLVVTQDLVQLGVLDAKDPRARVAEADVHALDKATALARTAPNRPGTSALDSASKADRTDLALVGNPIARRAEQAALHAHAQGNDHEMVHSKLSAAFAVERLRQQEARETQKMRDSTASTHIPTKTDKTPSLFRRSGEAR